MPQSFQAFPASYVGPSFADAKVHDAMRVGVVTCRPETSLLDLARMMVGYGIHAIVVTGQESEGGPNPPQAVVSALDLAAAAGRGEIGGLTAADVASTDVVTIESDQSVERAAKLMTEHGVAHLLAVQPATGEPVGVISALALAAVLAHGGM